MRKLVRVKNIREVLKEGTNKDLRGWSEEDIANSNALDACAIRVKDFLEALRIDYRDLIYDWFDYGPEVIIELDEDTARWAVKEIEKEFGDFYYVYVEGEEVHIDFSEEFEDENGEVNSRVTRQFEACGGKKSKKVVRMKKRNVNESELSEDENKVWRSVKLDRIAAEGFKKFLKDNGIYFEPSEDGNLIHFELLVSQEEENLCNTFLGKKPLNEK